MRTDPDCIFCKIVAGSIPCEKVFEDDKTLVFMDIAPLSKGHLLVIPKEHSSSILDMDSELYGHLASVLARIAKAVNAAISPDGMNVLQLNGKAANQVVPHVHMHIMPRWKDDGLTISAWEPVPGDKDEIAAVCGQIKSNL